MTDSYDNRLATQPETTAMLGPILTGEMVALVLYGVLLSNFSNFIRTSSWAQSGYPLRCVVLLVMVLTTAVTALYAVDIWDFGTYSPATDTAYLEQGAVSSALQPLFLVVIAVTVQITLLIRAARIIDVLRWRTVYFSVAVVLLVMELLAGTCAVVYEIRFALIPDEDFSIGKFDWTTSIIVWHWHAAVIDILISAIYVTNLTRRLNGVAHTVGAESVVRLIVLLVVRSAAYTAILAIVSASAMSAFPGWDLMTEDIYYAFWIPLPVLYALSLFTTLSIRERVTAELDHQNESRRRSLSGNGVVGKGSSHSKRKWCNNAARSKLGSTRTSRRGWNLTSLCAGGMSASTLAPPCAFEGVRVEREVIVSRSEVMHIDSTPAVHSTHTEGSRPPLDTLFQYHTAPGDEEKKVLGIRASPPLRTDADHGAGHWSASWHDPDESFEDDHDADYRRRKKRMRDK